MSGLGSLLSRLNWSLLTPVVVLSCLQRMRKLWNIPQVLFMSLVCCLPRRSSSTGFEWGQVSGGMQKQDKKLQSLGLCLIVLEPTLFKRHVLTQQIFYKKYELMVEFALWALLVYSITSVCNCCAAITLGSKTMHCFYTLVPLVFALLYSLQAPLQIVYLTGWRAVESKLACLVGVAVFAICMLMLSLPESWDVLLMHIRGMERKADLHMQALSLALSDYPKDSKRPSFTITMRFLMSAFMSIASAGMVLPALRFSQTLLAIALNPGPGNPLVSRLMVCAEHFAPLIVTIACCGSDFIPVPSGGKAALIAAWLVLRFGCARLHLQSFLDTVTRSAYLLPDGLDITKDPKDKKIVDKIQYRTEYLVAAAAQLLALPILVMVLLLLHSRYSPAGNEACVTLQTVLGRSQAAEACRLLFAESVADTLHATERTAVLARQSPWLSSVISVMMHSHQHGGQIVLDFFFKLATLHFLPGALISRLCLLAVSLLAATWFCFTSAAAAYWYIGPEWVVFLFGVGARMEIATQHLPKPIPGGSQEERALEALAMAAKSSIPHATSGYVAPVTATGGVSGGESGNETEIAANVSKKEQ